MPRSGSFILGIKWKSQGLKPLWGGGPVIHFLYLYICTFHHSACFSSSDDTLFLCLSNISFNCSVAVLGTYTGRDRLSCRIRITDVQGSSLLRCDAALLAERFATFQRNVRGITQQHWVTSQKILILIYTAMKTSNPTIDVYILQMCPSTKYLQNTEYVPSGPKGHTEFPSFHKTVHAQKNSVNEYKFV